MTRRLLVLRPQDVAVALQVVLSPDAPLSQLADGVRLSQSEVHNAEQRLRAARLLRRRHRYPVHRALLEFVVHGVPYAFPGEPGAIAMGVPTGRSGPALRGRVRPAVSLVWPSECGEVQGAGLCPLYPRAVEVPRHNPLLYTWLTLVDALRVGVAHERELARSLLEDALGGPVPRAEGSAGSVSSR
jgi:hypothetical protein